MSRSRPSLRNARCTRLGPAPGGAVGFGYYLFMRQYWFPNPYKTQGVQNIEDRFSAGGGSPTHTPAGGTKRGTSGFILDNTFPVVVKNI